MGRRAHHQTAYTRAAGKDDVIQRQAGKGRTDLGAADKCRDLGIVEPFRQQLHQQCSSDGSELRQRDHRPVTRRKGFGEWREGDGHREIPGRHDADTAQRLKMNLRLGAQQPRAHFRAPPLRLHPLPQMLAGVLEPADWQQHIAHQRVVMGAP
ncbi:hypothetical protein D3C78_1056280 [compost metagenome]